MNRESVTSLLLFHVMREEKSASERDYARLKKKKGERMVVLLGPYSACTAPRLKKWNVKADDE